MRPSLQITTLSPLGPEKDRKLRASSSSVFCMSLAILMTVFLPLVILHSLKEKNILLIES